MLPTPLHTESFCNTGGIELLKTSPSPAIPHMRKNAQVQWEIPLHKANEQTHTLTVSTSLFPSQCSSFPETHTHTTYFSPICIFSPFPKTYTTNVYKVTNEIHLFLTWEYLVAETLKRNQTEIVEMKELIHQVKTHQKTSSTGKTRRKSKFQRWRRKLKQ